MQWNVTIDRASSETLEAKLNRSGASVRANLDHRPYIPDLASFNLDVSDSGEDNGGKRAAPVVSRFPEAPWPAGPRDPLQASRTPYGHLKNKNPPAWRAEGHASTTPFLPTQVATGLQNARVFWLPRLSTLHAFPEHGSSGSRADFVCGHSCGAATVSHRLPRDILCIV